MRTLAAAGAELAVAEDVLGDGRTPVFMLHGNPDSHDLWDCVVASLGDADLRVLRPDMPGFGDSPAPPADFDYRAGSTVPLWDEVLAELGVREPLIAVLHDFGGPWFLPWVARNPDRVRGLVLCNTLLHPSYRWHFFARVWQTPMLGEAAAAASTRWLFRREMRRGSRRLPAAYCDSCHAKMTPSVRASVLRTYRAHRDPSEVWREEWPRLMEVLPNIPTRVVWGQRDPYLPPAQAEVWGVPVTALAEAGHWSPVEAPGMVADAVLALSRR